MMLKHKFMRNYGCENELIVELLSSLFDYALVLIQPSLYMLMSVK